MILHRSPPARLGLLTLLCIVWLGIGSTATWAQEAETYTVKRGDTLLSIAQQFGLTVADVQRANGLRGTIVRVGTVLVVERPTPAPETLPPPTDAPLETSPTPPLPARDEPPAPPPASAEETSAERAPVTYGQYDVQAGDTFLRLAAQYGIAVDTLLALNDSVGTYLEPGQTLRLPPAFATTTHRVQRGENLYRISLRYGTTVAVLRDLNDLSNSNIRIGQRLKVPAEKAAPAPNMNALPPVVRSGTVTVYPTTFSGRPMASGRTYDPERFTVSHPDLPFGTIILVTNTANSRSTFAEVADRGPLDPSFILDVSAAVAQHLRLTADVTVEMRVID